MLEVAAGDASGAPLRHYDVWNGGELAPAERDGAAVVSVPLPPGGAGCIVSAPEGVVVRFPPPIRPRHATRATASALPSPIIGRVR